MFYSVPKRPNSQWLLKIGSQMRSVANLICLLGRKEAVRFRCHLNFCWFIAYSWPYHDLQDYISSRPRLLTFPRTTRHWDSFPGAIKLRAWTILAA